MTVFDFVVRRLRWLARVPFAPQLFDAMLLLWTTVRHRPRLRAIEEIEKRALALPGVRTVPHQFGGIGFANEKGEFAHLHGNGLLDVHLTRSAAAEITQAGLARPHHVFGESAWISFQVKDTADVEGAMALVKRGHELARR